MNKSEIIKMILRDNNGYISTADFVKNGVTIIEWSELIADLLPEERLDIKIKVIDENTRVMVLEPHGTIYEEICSSVL